MAGTAASVAANVAVGGGSDPVGRLVAGWPAAALLVSSKLLSALFDAAPGEVRSDGDPATAADAPGREGDAREAFA